MFRAGWWEGEGEIGSQIIEFFELEEPWKVEKGPGGHERKKKKKTIWHSLQGFLSRACGKTRISECLLLGVGRETVHRFYAGRRHCVHVSR